MPQRTSSTLVWVEHVQSLCREHGIKWLLVPDTRHYGWANIPARSIETSSPTDLVDYYTALHELAHVVEDLYGSEHTDDPDVVIAHEAAAWLWAFRMARLAADEAVVDDCLEGIADYNQRYRPRAMPASVIELAWLLERISGRQLAVRRAGAAAREVVVDVYPAPDGI